MKEHFRLRTNQIGKKALKRPFHHVPKTPSQFVRTQPSCGTNKFGMIIKNFSAESQVRLAQSNMDVRWSPPDNFEECYEKHKREFGYHWN